MRSCFCLVPAVLLAAAASPAALADDDEFFSLSANVALASEYRFRGISLSDRDPALQGGMDLTTESGFYLGTWASSIEEYAGSEVELDIYGGYRRDFGGLTGDVGLLAYTYPGSSDTAYLEVYSSLSGSAEMFNWKAGAAYVWSQENTGDQDNIYVYLNADASLGDSGLTALAHVAYEDGAFGDGKWDWSAGLAYGFRQFTLSVNYVDTNVHTNNGEGAIVGMISASF